MREKLRRAAALLASADGLLIAAGAGMGVDSGLPDFRGNAGFWNAYPALGAARVPFIDVASPSTFHRDPRLAWGFYGHRLDLYRKTVPHEGFQALLRWARGMANGAFVFTSNVDGQFQRAGFAAETVYECHGSLHWLQCLESCCADVWSADDLGIAVNDLKCQWLGALPTCPRCSALLRPNLLMFGDGEWLARRYQQQQGRLRSWMQGVRRLVIVELGAGTYIPSVRHFTESLSEREGLGLIRINPRESNVPRSRDVGLPTGALDGLRLVDKALVRV